MDGWAKGRNGTFRIHHVSYTLSETSVVVEVWSRRVRGTKSPPLVLYLPHKSAVELAHKLIGGVVLAQQRVEEPRGEAR